MEAGGKTYTEFVNEVIRRGIEAVERDYAERPSEREGSIAGFKACADKTPIDLVALYFDANKTAEAKRSAGDFTTESLGDYWYHRCFAVEVEWVLNCLSAALRTSLLDHLPTARGVMLAAEIVGVAAVR